jgi:predicted transcriptional regulator
MTKAQRKLTPAEWQIMEAVWKHDGSATVRGVLEMAFPGGEKAYTTVQTVMNKLVEKRLLAREKTGLVNFYEATRSRDDMVRVEMSSLLAGVFGGSIPELASSLLSLDDLGQSELDDIKRIIDQKERDLREGDK